MKFDYRVIPTEQYPVRPNIVRLGTAACDLIETTPVPFKGELYRFEYVRGKEVKERYTTGQYSCSRIVNVRTGEEMSRFAYRHQFGSAFADGDVVYSSCVRSNLNNPEAWGGDTIDIYRSADLREWECISTISLPGWAFYNTNLCRKGNVYTLLAEIAAPEEECGPAPFTFRFFRSENMTDWELLPQEYAFQKDRYAGSPSIYSVEGDPYYYVGYLEEYPDERYANSLARTLDFISWEYSPINPVLMYDEAEDKKTQNLGFTRAELARIRAALDINNSDMELCEYEGRTIIFYSWGNQHGNEFFATAYYDGSLKEFLQAYFRIIPAEE